ncbi:FCD domain-containing protein [uncultured Roseobacter sp.]|uniref:FCD domain-containing protein n=1 Tax=uncultured Roseobacter sp. TaxID=114847 RepID=UPI0026325F33|nr:FCD domain-containing protein [uncultured Roseobacter sp.]
MKRAGRSIPCTSAGFPRCAQKATAVFQMQMVRLSGNRELERVLTNLNARLRLVRWVDMADWCGLTSAHHSKVVTALAAGDGPGAATAMRTHMSRRREQATEAARKIILRPYAPS